jgi:nitrogen-specific signal transduction histidine kinase
LLDSSTSKGKKGYGLGLGISLRLLQKAHGMLEIHSDAPQPDIRLIIPSIRMEELKRSG